MATGAPAHVYVYYRVVADTPAARDAVAALFATIADATGVAGRLLARCDDAATWMEIYEPVDDAAAFVRRLATLVRTQRIAGLAVEGKRHTECFAPPPAMKSAPSRRTLVPRAR